MNPSTPIDLAVAVSAVDHIRGPARARVTVVEYGDFQCPICRAAEPGLRMTLERFNEQVRLVYRHFPAESVHPHALMAAEAAEAAEAAAAQGQFWPMHDRLMRHDAGLGRSALEAHAQAIGLDMPTFIAVLDDEVYRQRVREHMAGAARSHLRATPGFYVNGYVCDVSGGINALAERITQLV